MAQETFQRVEKKYLLTLRQYRELRQEMQGMIRPDVYGAYTICNIYYDTPEYDLIRTSLEKPYYKEKLRMRSYGVAQAEEPVFLEIKKKCGGIVYKRRCEMKLSQASEYMACGIRPKIHCQIMDELDWFQKRYSLEPKVYIAYDREAWSGIEDTELRVTFDTAIRYREENLSLASGTGGVPLLPGDTVLMEVKLPESMPLWMAQMLSKHQIYPASFSKYGTYYCQKMAQSRMRESKGEYKYA